MDYTNFDKGSVTPNIELSLYRSLNHIGVLALKLDGSYTLMYGNDRFFEIIGYNKTDFERLMKNRCCGFIYPDDLAVANTALQKALDAGHTKVDWEMRIVTETRQLKHLQITGDLSYHENGDIFMYGVALDITRAKATESNLRSRYELLLSERESIDKGAIGSFWMDLTANICSSGHSINQYILEQQNCSTVDDFFALDYANNPDTERLTEFKKVFNRSSLINSFKNGIYTVNFEHKYQVAPGRFEWIDSIIKMRSNPENGHVEGLLYARNVHYEKMQQALCQKLIDVEYDHVIIFDANTEIIEMTQGIGKLTKVIAKKGMAYSEYMNRVIDKHVERELRNNYKAHLNIDFIKKQLAKNKSYVYTLTLVNDNSKHLQMRTRFVYLDEYHETIAISISDMTEYFRREKKTNERLLSALAAEKANSAKTYFLSRMSHDIRTPLSAIIGMTSLALDSAVSSNTIDYLNKIKESSNFLLSLINDILDMATIESGKFTLSPSCYEYNDFINSIVAMFEAQCKRKNIEFIMDHGILANMNLPIMVDVVRFNQVFFNILSNAIKYTNPGGTVQFRIYDISFENNYFSGNFEIKDTGIGIDEEFQKVLFEPFTKENAADYNIQGTGLGLSITKTIIDAMDGTITIDSTKNVGTCVTIRLEAPIAANADLSVRASAESFEESVATVKNARVLLVEDHALNNEIITKNLEKYEIQVTNAFNGKEALEFFAKSPDHSFDAILMDIHMPIMNGLLATEAIRQLGRKDAAEIPIIALSANAFSEDVNLSLSAGMNAHLSKPVNIEELLITLAQFIK